MSTTRKPQDETQRAHAKALGARIRFWRVSRGVTMVEMGRAIGVSQQQLQKYEKGQNRISVFRLEQISQLLNIDMATLLDCEIRKDADAKAAWDALWEDLQHPQKRHLVTQMGEMVAQITL